MATSVLTVLNLVAVAVLGTALGHGSTTTLEITASDKDTGSWLAKVGETKVAVEHKHQEGNVGSGAWKLKLSQSSDFEENDISEDKNLQERDAPTDDSPDQPMGTQDSYAFPPTSGYPMAWEFQPQTLHETLTPPGAYQESNYYSSAPETMLRPPPALPPYSYNMQARQMQPLAYPITPSFAPSRIQRRFMPGPVQQYPYDTLRYELRPRYNPPVYDPTFETNRLERTFVNDVNQPNMVSQSYLPLWQNPELKVPQQDGVVQQETFHRGDIFGQQNYFPHRRPEPVNTYEYTAVIIPNAEELSSMDQATRKIEDSIQVQNGMSNNPDPGMEQVGQPFMYAPNSVTESLQAQNLAETNGQNLLLSPESPSQIPDSGAPNADTEQKYVIVEALVMSNPETPPAQELSRGDNSQQPLSYNQNFAPREYSENIEGLKVPQPLPLIVNENTQDAPRMISDYSAPSYGMNPPPLVEQRSPNENEVVPEHKEVQEYHPYVADIAFRPRGYIPIQEVDTAISYMPTSVLKEGETGPAKMDATTPEVNIASE